MEGRALLLPRRPIGGAGEQVKPGLYCHSGSTRERRREDYVYSEDDPIRNPKKKGEIF